MAKSTLITLIFTIFQLSTSSFLSSHLYSNAHFSHKGDVKVVYVPVCRPDCYKPSPIEHQHFATIKHSEKPHAIDVFALNQQSQHENTHLDISTHQFQPSFQAESHKEQTFDSKHYQELFKNAIETQSQHKELSNVESPSHHKESIGYNVQSHDHKSLSDYATNLESQSQGGLTQHFSKFNHNEGKAVVHQQQDHHSSEHKQTVHHHGSGQSHQELKQEHDHSHDEGHHEEEHHEEHDEHHHHHHKDKNIHYEFEYSVNDKKTGDIKRQKEVRQGDQIDGEYSLVEEDGNVRTVKYQADWKSGFHAQVHNSKTKPLG